MTPAYYYLRFIALIPLILFASCKKEDPYVERPVEVLYNLAIDRFKAKSYDKAAKSFEEVERQHPYSPWAKKAQLMAAYCYFSKEKYEDTLDLLERFLQLYPTDDSAAYAYYLKALCYYERVSDVTRDQKITKMAYEALEEVVKRFPESKYATDAQYKLDLAKDHLAGKEMQIGRFYQKNKQFFASIPRFQKVITEYQTTLHVEEALYRLVEAYLSLGLDEEAKKTAAILRHNYPSSKWYVYTYRLISGKKLKLNDLADSWWARSKLWVDKKIF
jgi:outer membrane protein assembly factor BamD